MKSKAQSIIEYTFIIVVVAAAFIAMRVYFQRAVQAGLKVFDNQLAPVDDKFVDPND